MSVTLIKVQPGENVMEVVNRLLRRSPEVEQEDDEEDDVRTPEHQRLHTAMVQFLRENTDPATAMAACVTVAAEIIAVCAKEDSGDPENPDSFDLVLGQMSSLLVETAAAMRNFDKNSA